MEEILSKIYYFGTGIDNFIKKIYKESYKQEASEGFIEYIRHNFKYKYAFERAIKLGHDSQLTFRKAFYMVIYAYMERLLSKYFVSELPFTEEFRKAVKVANPEDKSWLYTYIYNEKMPEEDIDQLDFFEKIFTKNSAVPAPQRLYKNSHMSAPFAIALINIMKNAFERALEDPRFLNNDALTALDKLKNNGPIELDKAFNYDYFSILADILHCRIRVLSFELGKDFTDENDKYYGNNLLFLSTLCIIVVKIKENYYTAILYGKNAETYGIVDKDQIDLYKEQLKCDEIERKNFSDALSCLDKTGGYFLKNLADAGIKKFDLRVLNTEVIKDIAEDVAKKEDEFNKRDCPDCSKILAHMNDVPAGNKCCRCPPDADGKSKLIKLLCTEHYICENCFQKYFLIRE